LEWPFEVEQGREETCYWYRWLESNLRERQMKRKRGGGNLGEGDCDLHYYIKENCDRCHTGVEWNCSEAAADSDRRIPLLGYLLMVRRMIM
jgi:hypothetical protein